MQQAPSNEGQPPPPAQTKGTVPSYPIVEHPLPKAQIQSEQESVKIAVCPPQTTEEKSADQKRERKAGPGKMFICCPLKQGLRAGQLFTACWGFCWFVFSTGWMISIGGAICALGSILGFVGMSRKSSKFLLVSQVLIGVAFAVLLAARIDWEKASDEPKLEQSWFKLYICWVAFSVLGYGYIGVIVTNRYKRYLEKQD